MALATVTQLRTYEGMPSQELAGVQSRGGKSAVARLYSREPIRLIDEDDDVRRAILTLTAMIAVDGATHQPGQAQTEDAVPARIVEIIEQRCAVCHAQHPSYEGIHVPPNGVLLDTPNVITNNRQAIKMAAVLTHFMPLNNVTGMTADERRVLEDWLRDD